MRSVWEAGAELPHFEALSGDRRTDVLIIGGGIAGVLCAYRLAEAGVDYILCEADTVCGGITKNTTAKITLQYGLVYHKFIREFGEDRARLYLQANAEAVGRYDALCKNIDCDFEERDSYVYSIDDREILRQEADALNRLGCAAELCDGLSLPIEVAGAVRVRAQAQFHPLKFISAICGGLNIYEHTKVREMIGNMAVTDKGRISAKKVIVATHFPFINKHGAYFLKMYQHRSYILALEGAKQVGGMYVDGSGEGLSFRDFGELLLLGGGSHRTGKRGGAWRELEAFAAEHYPDAKVKYRFATQDCMTLDGMPYIGRYSKNTPDLFVATGFNKWGMTSSMVAADLLTDMVMGRENRYAKVFDPSRTMLRPQLAVNAMEAVTNLFTPTVRRCPHLGCALKWNPEERSWDCPCHGSRFTEDGELIDNPATGDIKTKKDRS